MNRTSPIQKILVGLLLPFLSVGIVTALRLLLSQLNGGELTSPYLLYIIPIILHTYLAGWPAGVFTTIISAIAANYFLLNPGPTLLSTSSVIDVVLFLIQALIIAVILDRHVHSLYYLNQSNKQLQESRSKLKNIINSLFSLVVITDPSGLVSETNNAFDKLIASDFRLIFNRRITAMHPWSYSPAVQDRLHRALEKARQGQVVRYDEKLRLRQNKYIDVDLAVVPVLNDHGEQIYTIVSAIDISQRKAYEHELLLMEDSYRKLVNSNIMGMAISNKAGLITEANDAFLNLLGYSRAELEAQKINWQMLVPAERLQAEQQAVQEVLAKGYGAPVALDYRHRDGQLIPVLVSGVVIDQPDGIILSIFVDMAEQKKLDERKQQFLSSASHELKTPLTSLKGYSQLVARSLQQNNLAQVSRYSQRIDSQISKLEDLINGLLDITKIQTGTLALTPTVFDLNKLVATTVKAMQPTSNNHSFQFDPMRQVYVKADRQRIGQVLEVLLSNAIKYSPPGSKIALSVIADQGAARVTVQDFGIGIEQQELTKIFNKFFRSDEKYYPQGLGLGLYTAAAIIREHGGEITVESKKNQGAAFSFSLPLVELSLPERGHIEEEKVVRQ